MLKTFEHVSLNFFGLFSNSFDNYFSKELLRSKLSYLLYCARSPPSCQHVFFILMMLNLFPRFFPVVNVCCETLSLTEPLVYSWGPIRKAFDVHELFRGNTFFLWIIPHFGKYFVKCPNQSSSLWWAVRRWHVDTKVKRCPQLKMITFPHNDCTFSQLHTFSTCFFFFYFYSIYSLFISK